MAISFPTTVTQLEIESVSMRNQNNQLCYSVNLKILCILNWGQFECVILGISLISGKSSKEIQYRIASKENIWNAIH